MTSSHPDPSRAPGIREHRRRYVLQVPISPVIAAALADRWEATGESPARQVERLLEKEDER